MAIYGSASKKRSNFLESMCGVITRNGVPQFDLTEAAVKFARDFSSFTVGKFIRKSVDSNGIPKDGKAIGALYKDVAQNLTNAAREKLNL